MKNDTKSLSLIRIQYFKKNDSMKNKRGFASDNNSGVHPAIMQAMADANQGHVIGYGGDTYTEKAIQDFKGIFSHDIEVFFVFIGTAANALGLGAATRSWNSIICAETAHINEDECGATEKFNGFKLIPVETTDGKLTVDLIKPHIKGIDFEHHSQPKVISITQVTELGTLYSLDEIRVIADFAHANNMYLHMDGARLANAAVALGCDFKAMTQDAGVDILSFGGTKNGMMYGEAIVFFEPQLADEFKYMRKQGMQLASKMRFISAQFSRYLQGDLWKELATHANAMAQKLAQAVKDIPHVELTRAVEANGVFAIVPPEIIPELQKSFFFYLWDEQTSEVRWMTSFDTTEEDIEAFAALLKKQTNSL
jgi:threonine aldolase